MSVTPPATISTKHVIIVNDDAWVNNLFCELLEEAGYTCQTALDGDVGLQLIQDQTEPFVLLLNYFMPVMTGYGVLLRLEKQPELLALARTIFFSSNLGKNAPLLDLLARHAIPFLPTPFDIDDLMALVNTASGKTP